MIKLIASDFDGTFYRKRKILKADRKRIEEWQKSGRLFGFVTGRGTNFFRTVSEAGLSPDFIVIYNGALIADADGNIIFEDFIRRETFLRIEEYFRGIEDIESYDVTDETDDYHQFYARFESPDRAFETAEELNRLFGDEVTAFVNCENINIAPKGSSKAASVGIVLEHFGLKKEEAVTVGDDFNDLEMINEYNGRVMRTARKAVKEKAGARCCGVGWLAAELMKEEQEEYK